VYYCVWVGGVVVVDVFSVVVVYGMLLLLCLQCARRTVLNEDSCAHVACVGAPDLPSHLGMHMRGDCKRACACAV
jgi:hypothetical protein